jgi:hypothetical protein
MTINRKLHARFRRMRLLTYALLTGLSYANAAIGEPFAARKSSLANSNEIVIGNDGVAHPTTDILIEAVHVQSADTQNASLQIVERPDLQVATLGGVDPARFGGEATDSNIQTGVTYDPATKHYSAAEISSLI